MNGQHWSDYSEAELAAIKRGATIHASRPAPVPPDVTAETRRVLVPVASESAYPPEWLPEVAARRAGAVNATQTPAEWMRDNAPDPHAHRNGTAPTGSPAAEAYPAEWLSGADLNLPRGGLGGEGFLNRRAA
jgi:hypothetical protein